MFLWKQNEEKDGMWKMNEQTFWLDVIFLHCWDGDIYSHISSPYTNEVMIHSTFFSLLVSWMCQGKSDVSAGEECQATCLFAYFIYFFNDYDIITW